MYKVDGIHQGTTSLSRLFKRMTRLEHFQLTIGKLGIAYWSISVGVRLKYGYINHMCLFTFHYSYFYCHRDVKQTLPLTSGLSSTLKSTKHEFHNTSSQALASQKQFHAINQKDPQVNKKFAEENNSGRKSTTPQRQIRYFQLILRMVYHNNNLVRMTNNGYIWTM